jgi:GABA(A) receptor-associated protein
MVFGKFVEDVRAHIPSLDSRTALFFFLSDNTLPPISIIMATLYEKHKSSDGFLYITYSCENTFG